MVMVQEGPQKSGGVKPESSVLGNSLREYEALAKEVKVLRQAVDSMSAQGVVCMRCIVIATAYCAVSGTATGMLAESMC